MLDKLKITPVCWTAGPSLAASFEPLARRRNVPRLSRLCRYFFGRCSSEMAELVALPYPPGTSTRYSNRLHDFPATNPRFYEDVFVKNFFLAKIGPGILCVYRILSLDQ